MVQSPAEGMRFFRRGTMRHLKWAVLSACLIAAAPGYSATLLVRPGQSIQHAVDRAQPGDTVAVLPGTYHEAGRPCPTNANHRCAVVVTKDDIRLQGLGTPGHPVLLEASPGQDQGIAFAKPGATGSVCLTTPSQRIQGAAVRGFTVNGFGGD